ncbi:hypothetical protein AAMO2058_000240200 [Amorphochlora amoebiformis]
MACVRVLSGATLERALVLGTAIWVKARLVSSQEWGLAACVLALVVSGMIAEASWGKLDRNAHRAGTGPGILLSSMAFVLPACLIGREVGRESRVVRKLVTTLIIAALAHRAAHVLRYLSRKLPETFSRFLIAILPLLTLFGTLASRSFATFGLALVVGSTQTIASILFFRAEFSKSFSLGELESSVTLLSVPGANLFLRLVGQHVRLESEVARIGEGALAAILVATASTWAILVKSRRLFQEMETTKTNRMFSSYIAVSALAWGLYGACLVLTGYTLCYLYAGREPIAALVQTYFVEEATRGNVAIILTLWIGLLLPGLYLSPRTTTTSTTAPRNNERKASREIKNINSGARRVVTLLGKDISQISARKWYHFLAVGLFTPAIVLSPAFTSFAFVLAFVLFLCIETIRLSRLYPTAKPLQAFLTQLLDHREKGLLIVSHIYLLLGCALPVILTLLLDRDSYPICAPLSGVISLGIGDSFASIVGSNYGGKILTRFQGGGKSLEGTLACLFSMVLFGWSLETYLESSFSPDSTALSGGFKMILGASTLTALLEASTDQMDNLYLPQYYLTWCLLLWEKL